MKTGAVVLALLVMAAQDRPELGKEVADIELKKDLKLSDFRAADGKDGKIVVVYFWSYKCPSGAPQLPAAKTFAEKVAGKDSGVEFISVAAYGESASDVETYVRDNDIAYPVIHDEGRRIAKHFGAGKVNTTYVIDAKGVLRYRGAFTGRGGSAEAAVKAVKEGKEPTGNDGKFAG